MNSSPPASETDAKPYPSPSASCSWLKDETYDRLITEVQDPAEVVKKINEAVEALSRS